MKLSIDPSEIKRLAVSLKEEKLKEIKILERIVSSADYNAVSVGTGIEFAGTSEKNFLDGKVLVSMITCGERPSTYDYKTMGTTTDFPCTMSYEDGIYMLYLPPTPSVKIGLPGPNIGRYTGYLVRNLIEKFEEENGKIEMMSSPVIVLMFGFTKDIKKGRYYDADNRDNKRILDAMTGVFYPDDNVMEITTVHMGAITERECTMVYIMEMEDLPSWISKNFSSLKAHILR